MNVSPLLARFSVLRLMKKYASEGTIARPQEARFNSAPLVLEHSFIRASTSPDFFVSPNRKYHSDSVRIVAVVRESEIFHPSLVRVVFSCVERANKREVSNQVSNMTGWKEL